jgi:hypothetical protein
VSGVQNPSVAAVLVRSRVHIDLLRNVLCGWFWRGEGIVVLLVGSGGIRWRHR